MKKIIEICKNDLKNYMNYRMLHMILIVAVVFALAMGFFDQMNYLLFIYISIFIFPVIIHSIMLFIEREENNYLPKSLCDAKLSEVILAKYLSSLLLNLIPFILYTVILFVVINVNFSFILFLLVYILGLLVHIAIGYGIAIISKNHIKMLAMYVAYIVICSFVPFISLMNYIPDNLDYIFIFSPAYLSAILLENISFGYLFSDVFLIIISIVLQLAVITALMIWAIIPYYKEHVKKVCELK